MAGRHVCAASERFDIERLRILTVDPVAHASKDREIAQVMLVGLGHVRNRATRPTGGRTARVEGRLRRYDGRVQLTFRRDDLSSPQVRALIAGHLEDMHQHSPPESVHALHVDALRDPDVTFWSVWDGDGLVGCGALKRLDDVRGEIKSMRVVGAYRRRGAGRAILEHLVTEARARGMRSLWLETGSPEAFTPARRLYESAGFRSCSPFDGYVDDPYSVFMTLDL